MSTAPTPITKITPVPQRNDKPSTFISDADIWVSQHGTWTDETNALGTNVYNNAVDAETAASNAATSATNAATSASNAETTKTETETIKSETQDIYDNTAALLNFQGDWSSATGSASVGESYLHDSRYWKLLVNLADITASEPTEANSDWALIFGASLYEVSKSMQANEAFVATLTTDEDNPFVAVVKEESQIAETNGNWIVNTSGTDYDADSGIEATVTPGLTVAVAFEYTNEFFSVTSQDSLPYGLEFSADGTKLFVIGQTNDNVYQYTLSTAWDVSTASFDLSFDVSPQTTGPTGIFFKPDGTRMYITGNGSEIYQYDLSTGWDLTTVSYSGFNITLAEDTGIKDIFIKSDGLKMLVIASPSGVAFQYTLGTAWNIATATYDSISADLSSEITEAYSMSVKSDGTVMMIMNFGNDTIYQYSFSTPWDLSTVAYDSASRSVTSQETAPAGFFAKPDGSFLYIIGHTNDKVFEYSVGKAWDLAGYDNQYLTAITNSSGQINTEYWTDINSAAVDDTLNGNDIFYSISADGGDTMKVFKNGEGTRDIVRNNGGTWEYNDNKTYASATWVAASTNSRSGALAEAMDAAGDTVPDISSTTDPSDNFSVTAQGTDPIGLFFKPDGTKMYVSLDSTNVYYQYTLSTPWDVSTASYDSKSFNPAEIGSAISSIHIKPDGTKMYLHDSSTTVYQYTLSTAWDISTASYDSASYTVQVNTRQVVLSETGDKLYNVTLNGDIYEHDLSTPWDVSTASYNGVTLDFTALVRGSGLHGISFDSTGNTMVTADGSQRFIDQWYLPTAFDLSTAYWTGLSYDISSGVTNVRNIFLQPDGSNFFMPDDLNERIERYNIPDTIVISSNRMDEAQMESAGDADFPALGNTLDLAVTMRRVNDSTMEFSSATLNYDANAADTVAVPGTDYTWNLPAANKLEFKALVAGNYKIKVR